VLEGAPENQLIHAWSDLCNVRPDGPSLEFRNVYPHVTTVKGNRFRFRDGEPNSMKENLVKLFDRATGNPSLTARVEA